jgi:diadenosine tetraphosphatase ApaH/serine/threonine PP2A family protein phosphatase
MCCGALLVATEEQRVIGEPRVGQGRDHVVVITGGKICVCYGNVHTLAKGISFGAQKVNCEAVYDNISVFKVESRVEDIVGDLVAAEKFCKGKRVS